MQEDHPQRSSDCRPTRAYSRQQPCSGARSRLFPSLPDPRVGRLPGGSGAFPPVHAAGSLPSKQRVGGSSPSRGAMGSASGSSACVADRPVWRAPGRPDVAANVAAPVPAGSRPLNLTARAAGPRTPGWSDQWPRQLQRLVGRRADWGSASSGTFTETADRLGCASHLLDEPDAVRCVRVQLGLIHGAELVAPRGLVRAVVEKVGVLEEVVDL